MVGHPTDAELMELALVQAHRAADMGEVPVGAVVVNAEGEILARAHNLRESGADPTGHAELIAIRQAAQAQGHWRLEGCSVVVTLEPCAMCAGAISLTRIGRLYFGAADPKGGAVEHGARVFNQPTCHHTPDVYGGIDAGRCGILLRSFFAKLR